MKLLDLFCGAGGCAVGYHRAGFTEIVGVDNKFQKRYPFEFVQMDALEYVIQHGYKFDVIHASPPCQAYSVTRSLANDNHPNLVTIVRTILQSVNKPYVIENVVGAPLINPITLCGTMFDLQVIRHRLFECDPVIWWGPKPHTCKALYTHSSHGQMSAFKNGATAITVVGNNYLLEDGRIAMGIDWMIKKELSQAIPPAYTEWLGKEILKRVIGKG